MSSFDDSAFSDFDEEVVSPLADAIDDARIQEDNQQNSSTKTEDFLDTVIDDIVEPDSTYNPDFEFPSLEELPNVSDFKIKILDIMQDIELAMNSLTVREKDIPVLTVINKNFKSLLESLPTQGRVSQSNIDTYDKFENLYERVMNQ